MATIWTQEVDRGNYPGPTLVPTHFERWSSRRTSAMYRSDNNPDTVAYIQCWSDNASTVAWSSRLSSSCVVAQETYRTIGLGDAVSNMRVSATRVPGSINRMADASSRAWCEPYLSMWIYLSLHGNRYQ
ncbi:hypothetical protein PHMEG_0008457 [Phytophthora megakarya]|uniref:Uncharacterized protein n=1 Tax=Phytophthora megakarya TaxID=4795 RepID=A0A225WL57_9STRA|nr:hypothetical protein PHMEG_0008457 [Phytophthora megakarya]